jgi:DAK2 domain fusion protein YloV
MIIFASNELLKHKHITDRLNVFPVPDGDTGSNMSYTALAAAKEVFSSNSSDIYEIAKLAARGALRGAKGNSGVILSQLYRGFAEGLIDKKRCGAVELAYCLQRACMTAYKAVMKPKEGTILTMSRLLAQKAGDYTEGADIQQVFRDLIEYGEEVLESTTAMLSELQHANVVDSGAEGLLTLLKGAYKAMSTEGDIVLITSVDSHTIKPYLSGDSYSDIKFTYCTEYIINLGPNINIDLSGYRRYLDGFGDSIVLVQDTDIIKIHLHTDNPGIVLEDAMKKGQLSNIKIDNMRFQHKHLLDFEEVVPDDSENIAILAIVRGKWFGVLFDSMGAIPILRSLEAPLKVGDIKDKILSVKPSNVIILPNYEDMISVAKQAALEIKNKKIFVAPSKFVTEGIAAVLNIDKNGNAQHITDKLSEVFKSVKTLIITTSKDDEKVASVDSELIAADFNIDECVIKALNKLISTGKELVTMYCGVGIEEEDADRVINMLRDKYPDIESEIYISSHPDSHYIISIE